MYVENNITIPNFDEYLIEYFNKWKEYNYKNIRLGEPIVKLFHFFIIIFVYIWTI